MRKKKIIEDEAKAQFFKLFNGYHLTEREQKWVWDRYQEVKAAI
jgi:hypothetical protein